ncbi:MAG: hypothetical protein WC830_05575 [Burkholderiales bacterium]|jgi:hypothetical protein
MRIRRIALLRKALGGEERLWIAWWAWGLPALTIYVGLYVLEDELRSTADLGADLVAVCKLLLFCLWTSMAWRCAGNVDTPAWTLAARAALVLAVVLTAITF